MKPLTQRIRDLVRSVEESGRALNLLAVNANARRGEAEAALEQLEVAEAAVKHLAETVQPGRSPIKHLEGQELHESYATMVVRVARGEQAVCVGDKGLKDLGVNYALPPHAPFWEAQRAPYYGGLLAYERLVRELIEAEGVMFWREEIDGEWRIIDTRWLEAHADIRAWVMRAWPGGHVCRFCGMNENPKADALARVDIERRYGRHMIGDTVVLPPGGVLLTHGSPLLPNPHTTSQDSKGSFPERCRPLWLEWLRIASLYATQDAAEAADAVAGRTSRVVRDRWLAGLLTQGEAHG